MRILMLLLLVLVGGIEITENHTVSVEPGYGLQINHNQGSLLNNGTIFLEANTPGIYTVGNGEGLANNAIDYGPNRTDKKSIDLSFMASKQGDNYSITFDEDYMVNNYTIFLEDKKLNHFHDLNSGAYVFANDTNVRERFVVHFRSASLSNTEEFANTANVRAWVHQNTAYIHPHADLGNKNLRMTDMGGRTVFNKQVNLAANQQEEISLPELSAGAYLLHIEGQKPVKVVIY